MDVGISNETGVTDATGAVEFDTGPSADSTFLLQDMTLAPPMPMDGGVMAVVQDCSAIESNDGWTVCEAAVGHARLSLKTAWAVLTCAQRRVLDV